MFGSKVAGYLKLTFQLYHQKQIIYMRTIVGHRLSLFIDEIFPHNKLKFCFFYECSQMLGNGIKMNMETHKNMVSKNIIHS